MIYRLILILSLYLPFQIALSPIPGIDLASIRVFILILFFIWLAESLRQKKIYLPKNLQTFFLLSFLFLSFFSMFFSRNYEWSIRKLLFLFSIFPTFFVFSALVNDTKKIKKIIKALVISGAAASIIGIIQFIFQFFIGEGQLVQIWSRYFTVPFLGKTFSKSVLEHPSWLVNISGSTYFRSISVFPDPHMFSLYLGILLPLSFFLWTSSKKKIWLIFSILIFISDILTFSRGAYLGLVAGVLFIVFYLFFKKGGKYKWIPLASSIIILAVFIIPSPVSSRLFASFDIQEGSNLGRLEMWKKAGEAIINNPLTGVGVGNFPVEIDPLAGYREPIYAHNTYLDIMADAGIISGLIWIGIILISIKDFLKKSKDEIIFLGTAASLIIFSAHSLVETGIYSPVVLALFLIIISFSNIHENKKLS